MRDETKAGCFGFLFHPLRQWWRPSSPAPTPQVPFEVACPCGTLARGMRQARHQVLTCAACGRPVFILPFSPFLIASPTIAPARFGPAKSRPRSPWRRPLLAALLTLVAAAGILAALLPHLLRPAYPSPEPRTLADDMQAGQRALAQGKFQSAARALKAAWDRQAEHPDRLSRAQRRRLAQLHRQADLLSDLSSESLEEILRHAADLIADPEEWQREFTKRYRGKAVVFNTEVRPDPARKFQLDYTVFLDDRPAQLDLANVQLLDLLPLEKPQRLLFGLRLARVDLQAGGVWVIHFEPDSGVLLTDPDAAAACCLQPVEELEEVVRRQRLWLADL